MRRTPGRPLPCEGRGARSPEHGRRCRKDQSRGWSREKPGGAVRSADAARRGDMPGPAGGRIKGSAAPGGRRENGP